MWFVASRVVLQSSCRVFTPDRMLAGTCVNLKQLRLHMAALAGKVLSAVGCWILYFYYCYFFKLRGQEMLMGEEKAMCFQRIILFRGSISVKLFEREEVAPPGKDGVVRGSSAASGAQAHLGLLPPRDVALLASCQALVA